MPSRVGLLGSLVSFVLLTGCSAKHASSPRTLPAVPAAETDAAAGKKLIAHAQAIANAGNLHKGERRDCSGFVMDVFRSAGRPLRIPSEHQRYPNVSAMLHDWGLVEQRLFTGPPRPGDIVFFRNTTGALDGRITHVALVERVRDDGTVELIHFIGGRVRRDPMNLARPNDHTVNAYLRKKERKGDPTLAGELFVAYARF